MKRFYRLAHFSAQLARWFTALVLLAWALNLKDPHLLWLRPYETPVLIVLAGLGIGLGLRRARGISDKLQVALLIAALLLTVAGEARYQFRKHAVLNASGPRSVALGAHFIVGYYELDVIRPLIAKGLVGGVFVTQRNAAGKSFEELRQEIASLQALRKAAGLPPLMIATDQEGGIISRLSPPLAQRPPLAELASTAQEGDLEARAEDYGMQQGAELAALGVTVNFSPVVDLKLAHADNSLDFHSLIGRRAISADPQRTARVALGYSRGLQRQGVRATLKHFPGLGRVTEDTHHFSATLDESPREMSAMDWVPFRHVAERTDALLMLGHVVLSALDPDNPVSSSRKVIQGLLRGEWQYEGVLVTDDLTMGAAYNRGLCEFTVDALNAGVDLLLISYDVEQYYEAMYCAAQAYSAQRLDPALLERSRQRLMRPAAKSMH